MTEVAQVLSALRARRPLVHCLTGSVSAPLVADGLLALGARPMVTATIGEAPALVRTADALLVNLAALGEETQRAILPTVAAARESVVPWVLDPAVVGPTPVRTPLAHNLTRLRPEIVRGNASEIAVLAGAATTARGPDATVTVESAADRADALARSRETVVSVSGAVDLVTDGVRRVRVGGGHEWLPLVTGTGCLLGAVTAACRAVAPSFAAAAGACRIIAAAAELAAPRAHGPGSFRTALVDALFELQPDDLDRNSR